MTASALADKDLLGQNGIELGEIERVVENRGNKKQFLVVSRGGFLGFFEKEYAVPVDQVAVQGDTVRAPTMTEGQLEAMLPIDSTGTDFRSLDSGQTVSMTEQR